MKPPEEVCVHPSSLVPGTSKCSTVVEGGVHRSDAQMSKSFLTLLCDADLHEEQGRLRVRGGKWFLTAEAGNFAKL